MKRLGVKLGYLTPLRPMSYSQKEIKTSRLGCKRSQVQILSRRPFYLSLNTSIFHIYKLLFRSLISAHTCSKMQAKEWVPCGKNGVRAGLFFVRLHLALNRQNERHFSILASVKSTFHLIKFNRTGGSMARINIEECWWTDPRRSKLSKLLGSEDLADGCAVRAWRLAQEFWKNNQGHIPVHIFETLENSKHLLGCGLAELGDGWIYIRGSSQYLDWVREKKESAKKNGSKGGMKSALRPRNAKGQLTNTKEKDQANAKQKPSESKLSDSGSLSVSSSFSDSDSGTYSESELVPEAPKKLNSEIWEAYKAEYFLRYGVDPVRNASVNSKISQLGKRLGPEAIDVVMFFVRHPKTIYVGRLHDIGLCLADAEALRTQWVKGKAITNSDIKRFEQNQDRADLLKAIDEGRV